MPIQTTGEFITRHSQAGAKVRTDGNTLLFGDGAQLQPGSLGFPDGLYEPPDDKTVRQRFVVTYWKLRVGLAEGFFEAFKNVLVGRSFNNPTWLAELWGKVPSGDDEQAALEHCQNIVKKERKKLRAAQKVYSKLPDVVRRLEAAEAQEELERQREEAEIERRERLLGIEI